MSPTTTIEIQQTNDYRIFKFLKGNHPLVEDHVKQLMKSMSSYGNLTHILPIQVSKDMEVLDGQHRLEACKRLEWSLSYQIVDRNVTIDEVRKVMNLRRRNWTWQDFGYSYAKDGNSQYQQFMGLWDQYQLPCKLMLMLAGADESREDSRKAFKEGNLKIYDRSRMLKQLQQLQEIKDALVSINQPLQSHFLQAVYNVINSPEYNHSRMVDKFSKHANHVKVYSSITDNMRMIEDIYNFGQTDATRVRLF